MFFFTILLLLLIEPHRRKDLCHKFECQCKFFVVMRHNWRGGWKFGRGVFHCRLVAIQHSNSPSQLTYPFFRQGVPKVFFAMQNFLQGFKGYSAGNWIFWEVGFASLDREGKGFLFRTDCLAIPEISLNPVGDRMVYAFFKKGNSNKENRDISL